MAKQRYEVKLANTYHRPVVASILHESDMHQHEDRDTFIKNFCEYCEEMGDVKEFIITDIDGKAVGGVMVTGTRSFHYYGYGAAIQIVSAIVSQMDNGRILKQIIDQCFSLPQIKWVVTFKHLDNGNVLEVYRTKKEVK
ncbi:MAG: hypothetical protein [Caudoviricetes sp.]|nr:MAG: hypothetical protein [Caudoviricetes sp.]